MIHADQPAQNLPGHGLFQVLVNALSVTNQSGAHVLLGHLDGLITGLRGRCEFTVLLRADMTDFLERLAGRANTHFAPMATRHWLHRSWWERGHLARVVRETGARAYFTPNGLAAPGLAIPQVVFCQNPWALVRSARRRRDAPKAWLQRLGYRRAMRDAAVMVFNSHYMQEAYRRNAGFHERRGLVVYQAADEATRARAATSAAVRRVPGQIVCVSAMGPHKNVEVVLHALRLLLDRGCAAARLHVLGSWPDVAYQSRILALTRSLRLDDHVVFKGFVAREELDRHYAESMVFCLMSRCESFGIPAIEAQLFGTPVVSSNVCAIPEICGGGGIFCDPDDAQGVADALARLLNDADAWASFSRRAGENAARFSWATCTPPLASVFEELAGHG